MMQGSSSMCHIVGNGQRLSRGRLLFKPTIFGKDCSTYDPFRFATIQIEEPVKTTCHRNRVEADAQRQHHHRRDSCAKGKMLVSCFPCLFHCRNWERAERPLVTGYQLLVISATCLCSAVRDVRDCHSPLSTCLRGSGSPDHTTAAS